MTERSQGFWLTQSIALIVVLIAASLLVGCPSESAPPPFSYQVQVQDLKTGVAIERADVTIAIGGNIAAIGSVTDSMGFAIVDIDSSRAGKRGKLIVTAPDYGTYVKHITLTKDALPNVVQLKRKTEAATPPVPSKIATPPTPSAAAPTSEPTPTHSPAPEPSPTDTATSTATLTPTPSHTPKPQADAVVLDGGADLRPGADTWWHPRQTLPTGTELELVGYDPAFPDWVFVRTADGSAEGWTQLADLQINLDLADLPRVTPRPTLTYTPSPTPVTTPVGPLKLTFYYDPGSEHCTEGGGWAVNIHFIVEGGTGVYTYFWEGEQIYGPTTEREYIHTIKWGDAALAGTGRVESGGKAVQSGVFVPKPPQCP
jgi:hypothetical protein